MKKILLSKKVMRIAVIVVLTLVIIKGYLFYIKYDMDDKYNEYIVFIEEIKEKTDSKVSYYARIGEKFQDKFIVNIYKDKYSKQDYDLGIYSKFSYGDFIKIKGKIVIPEKLNNPGEFNYKLYLYSNNIYGIINTYSNVESVEKETTFKDKILKKSHRFKELVNKKIDENFDIENASLFKALVYGDKKDLDEDLKQNFENVGVSHLMSVSGTHIISFLCMLDLLFLRKNKKKNILKSFISIICIFLFILFTGFSVSIVRSGIMRITLIVTKLLKKKQNVKFSILISLGIILFFYPFAIFSTSLLLSYFAVIGIMLFKKYVYMSLKRVFLKNFKMLFKNKLLSKITKIVLDSISITISVQIFILPIEISVFNKLTFPIIISNAILSLATIPIRILGILSAGFINTPLFEIIIKLLNPMLKIVIKIISLLNKIHFEVNLKTMPFVFNFFYYFLIISIYLTIKLKNILKATNKRTLNNSKYNIPKLIKYLYRFNVVGATLITFLVISLNIYSIYFSKYVYFFNVEQGEMSYLKYNDESIIVDIGSLKEKLAFNVIKGFFKHENLYKVDVVILSHMDKDHINGLENLLDSFEVGQVFLSKPLKQDDEYLRVITILENKKVKYKHVKNGDVIKLKNITVKVLFPDNKFLVGKDNKNANSLICVVNVNNKRLLYMGDATSRTENILLKNNNDIKDIDILKVAHHGSKTSSNPEFISYISPKYGVISSKKSYYGHPHEDTITTLKGNNIATYITENIGAIKFNLN